MGETEKTQLWATGRIGGIIAPAVIVILAFLAYLPALDNFFTWDDFLWLYRAKTLASNPAQMFSIDVLYFDPLVYLTFWLNYQLNLLNPFWYHLFDLCVHAASGVLIYHLVLRHARDRFAALASGVLFVCAFAVVDAVVWSSSRVDLLAVFFSLSALLAFQLHLDDTSRPALAFSVLAYLLALGAKGTPIVIPCILVLMIYLARQPRRRYAILIPYAAITVIYVSLLFWKMVPAGKDGAIRLNLHNLVLALSGLFVPER